MPQYNVIDNNIIEEFITSELPIVEDNIIENIVNPETPKIIDDEVLTVYVPLATYEQPGIAKFSKSHFKVLSDGTVLPEILRKSFVSDGISTSLTIELKNEMVYYVAGYKEVILIAPEEPCTCHLFISYKDVYDPIGFTLPENVIHYGRLSKVIKDDIWEISIDTQGGIVFTVHRERGG